MHSPFGENQTRQVFNDERFEKIDASISQENPILANGCTNSRADLLQDCVPQNYTDDFGATRSSLLPDFSLWSAYDITSIQKFGIVTACMLPTQWEASLHDGAASDDSFPRNQSELSERTTRLPFPFLSLTSHRCSQCTRNSGHFNFTELNGDSRIRLLEHSQFALQ